MASIPTGGITEVVKKIGSKGPYFSLKKPGVIGGIGAGSLLLTGDDSETMIPPPITAESPNVVPTTPVEEVKVPVQEAVKEVLPTEEVPVKKPELKLPGMKSVVVPDLSHLDNTLNGLRKIRKEVDLVDPDGKLATAQDDLETQMVMARAVFEEAQRNARTEEEQKMVSTQWKEVASMLGEALVNIGTGIVGLKTGKDLSGVQFKQKDWGAEYDRIRKGTENKIKDAIVLLNLDQEAITAKKKEIKDTLEAQRKTQEEVIAEEQRAFLASQEGKTKEEIARAEATNRANLERYQTEVQAATTVYREEMGVAEQEARRKHDLIINAMNNQARILAAEGRADSSEAKELAKKQENFNDALIALNAYKNASGKSKLTYEKAFRDNADNLGMSYSTIEEILKKADTNMFVNWITNDQAEAIAEFEAMNPAGQPKPTSGTIQGGQPTPSPAPKPAGRRQWTE